MDPRQQAPGPGGLRCLFAWLPVWQCLGLHIPARPCNELWSTKRHHGQQGSVTVPCRMDVTVTCPFRASHQGITWGVAVTLQCKCPAKGQTSSATRKGTTQPTRTEVLTPCWGSSSSQAVQTGERKALALCTEDTERAKR